ncbi:MAG: type III-A CRISPR-associated protein Cas10/Csm1 [Limnoraphis robusta]|uniref:CRISPR system single-strand-specific deoxyribonuclease Cas10/Csm1 (subtype III-A) n=1 Tax=Limnoraphis robusta CS-951 TaxID=1637645 RepID=A0A0F5YGQ9_9CYAN|nr:type III-A CRISPR-associated protein Cas10/Csm1 [Limnoraphis robusta]KKD37842.1 CRISPR-associated protein Csm1 [Limnoraphis robusta CS-951]
MKSQDIALQVMQEAVLVLAKWVGLTDQFPTVQEDSVVTRAKIILSWTDNEPGCLRLLFDFVKLAQGQTKEYYCPVGEIKDSDPSIPYPVEEKPNLAHYKEDLKTALENLQPEDWNNLSLLTLFVEKYGSCLSFGESDIALIDMARSTAAVACAIGSASDATASIAPNLESENICLVAGDLSGIQKFIYTISSDGALKSLRARSFYLELVSEEIVQQLLDKLKLPRTSVIYAGGGNLYILAPAEKTENTIKEVRNKFNEWLYKKFQGKIFLALACHFFPVEQVATSEFAESWNKAIKEINQQKSRKFIDRIGDLLGCKTSYEQKCRVCHRDDTTDLEPLNPQEPDTVDACPICREMFKLGGKLLKVEAIIRSKEEKIKGEYPEPITFEFNTETVYYHIFNQWKTIINNPDTTLLVNDWTIEHYQFRHFCKVSPWFLGDYAQKSLKEEELDQTMRAGEFAEKAKGIKRVGYLRMDVDNLGKIFAQGLEEKTVQNLPRIAGLSRLMTYFFKVYLNSLAKERCANLPKRAKNLDEGDRPNLLFIYAGGDDLFVSGTWNEVVDFGFDVYQAFRAYTGYNPDITLSGGISLADYKFPLYQAANESGEAEDKAKGNGRDSLGLFGEVFKWHEWLGIENLDVVDQKVRDYLNSESKPHLLGILPFVKKLYNIDESYSRSFVRNLLATAQLQKQMIKEIEDKRNNEQYSGQIQDIRYYLHLPKVAYTLARLPKKVLDDEGFRKSLKSPYNAPYFQAIATWIELLNRQQN